MGSVDQFATGFVTSLAPITKATFAKSLLISSNSNTSSYGTFASANKHSYVQAFLNWGEQQTLISFSLSVYHLHNAC